MASGASKQRLVILDRDGVINEDSSKFVKSADEWIPIAGSIEAIAALSQGGFTVAVASNQSGIARGLFDIQALDEMHQKLSGLVVAAGGETDRQPVGLLFASGKGFTVANPINDVLSALNVEIDGEF